MRIHQMENAMLRRWIAAVAAAAFAFAPLLAFACTGIRLTAADGSIVAARTLEFSIDLDSNVLVVPRGYARTGTTPDGKEGLKWTSKYASVGANGVGLPVIFDGFNEKGLYAGLFYFPTSAGYMPYAAADAGKTLAPWGAWLLDFGKTSPASRRSRPITRQCHRPSRRLSGLGLRSRGPFQGAGQASGGSIVIEYTGGKLNVYDEPARRHHQFAGVRLAHDQSAQLSESCSIRATCRR